MIDWYTVKAEINIRNQFEKKKQLKIKQWKMHTEWCLAQLNKSGLNQST